MSYQRVIPRDLFNDANLLKCMGRLWILTEAEFGDSGVSFIYDDAPFDIWQDPGDGSTYVSNILVRINNVDYIMRRPMNSKEPWPLYFMHRDKAIDVFTEDGLLSRQMKKFIGMDD